MPLDAQLELVGVARPCRVGPGGAGTGVRPVVARLVQVRPAAPAPAAPAGADLRRGMAAATPAEADEVEAARRVVDRRGPPAGGRGAAERRVEAERERLRLGGGERGRG